LLVLLSSSSSPTLENLNYEWWSLSRAGQEAERDFYFAERIADAF
jgi:hypothetical protein